MTRAATTLHALSAWTLALAGLAATLPAEAARRDAPEPVAVDAAFKPAEQAAELLKQYGNDSHYKGIRRVAVTQFTVQFITRDSITAETASGFGSSGASVTGHYQLSGVGEPEFQAATEAVHAEFLRQLQAGGLEVVPTEQVQAAPTWRRLAASGQALPQRADDQVTVAPAGMALYGVSQSVLSLAKTTQQGGGLLGSLSAMSQVTQAIGQGGDLATLQQELGGAALLEVVLRVHFAQLTNHNRGFLGRMASTARVSANLAPTITTARLSVAREGASVGFELTRPLSLDPAAMAEMRKAPTSTGDMAAAVGLGLLRAAIGAGRPSSSNSMEAVADPAKWREVMGEGMGAAGQMFVQRLNSVR
jgi:hypothetical protein